MTSNDFNNVTFSSDAMDEVIDHLGYSRHSRNMAYLKVLLSHAGRDNGYSSDPVDSDLLVQAIWQTHDPAQLKSRRKNLSTIRNSVNRDLSRLFKDGNNPEGVTISADHALVVSQEAKEALYAPFANHFTNANSPDIEKASALLDALAEMAEKGVPLLDGTENLAEKLKRAVQALEKGGALPDFEEEPPEEELEEADEEDDEEIEVLEEEDDVEEILDEDIEELDEAEEEELDILDDEDEVEEILDDDLEEIDETEEEELDTLDGEDEVEELLDEDVEEIDESDDEEIDILDDDEGLEEIPEGELEEVADEQDEELDILDDDDTLEEIPEDEIEEVDEDDALEEISDDDIEEIDEDDALEEISDDEIEEVDEDDALEEISDDEIEEVDEDDPLEEISDDDIEEVDEDDALEEISDDEIEEVDEDAPPWAADEDPDAMQERADRFDALLNESERYYNRYIHIPSGRYPALDPVTGQEVLADIEEFLAGKYPVTNALFEVFIGRTGYKTTAEERGFGAVYEPRLTRQSRGRRISLSTSKGLRLIRGANWYKPSGARSSVHTSAHHPVVQVSYEDAMAFASWSGKRLPTLAQWLAMGGKSDSPYPWGDAWASHLCNTEEVGAGGTLPVDTFPKGASPFGVYDLMGNALEWVSDQIPEKGGEPVKTAVGGSFLSDRSLIRQQLQSFDTRFSSNVLGFRCIGW